MKEIKPIAEGSKPQGSVAPTSGAPSSAKATKNMNISTKNIYWAIPILMFSGALAGAAGSHVVFQVRELFQIAPERLGMPPRPPQIEREIQLYAIANHGLGFGALGFFLGSVLATGLGVFGGSMSAGLRLFLFGGGLGSLLGAVGGAVAYLTNEALLVVPLDEIFKAMLIHLPNWLLLAFAVAIAAALARLPGVRTGRLLMSALVAGFLAALIYPLLALLLFPAASSDRPIPFEFGLRMLCFALGGAVLGLAAARWLQSPEPAA